MGVAITEVGVAWSGRGGIGGGERGVANPRGWACRGRGLSFSGAWPSRGGSWASRELAAAARVGPAARAERRAAAAAAGTVLGPRSVLPALLLRSSLLCFLALRPPSSPPHRAGAAMPPPRRSIVEVKVLDVQKRRVPNKHYVSAARPRPGSAPASRTPDPDTSAPPGAWLGRASFPPLLPTGSRPGPGRVAHWREAEAPPGPLGSPPRLPQVARAGPLLSSSCSRVPLLEPSFAPLQSVMPALNPKSFGGKFVHFFFQMSGESLLQPTEPMGMGGGGNGPAEIWKAEAPRWEGRGGLCAKGNSGPGGFCKVGEKKGRKGTRRWAINRLPSPVPQS